MTTAVIDASALLAMLLGEPGGSIVRERLRDCAVTTVNLAEAAAVFYRRGMPDAMVDAMLRPLPSLLVEFDEELAYASAKLAPLTRAAGLSLGDPACLALASRLGVPPLTADRSWLSVAKATGATIELIR